MIEEPQQPEGEEPEDESPEGAPGEPGEASPVDSAPGEPTSADSAADQPAADEEMPTDEPADSAPGEPADSAPVPDSADAAPGEAPGPEIEGAEALSKAIDGEPAGDADAPAEQEPAAEQAPAGQEPAAEPAPAEQPPAEREPAADAPAADAAAGVAPGERPRPGGRKKQEDSKSEDEVIPGAHLEPDLVLEEKPPAEAGEFGEYASYPEGEREPEEGAGTDESPAEPAPVAHTPLDLAADARYPATGKRKRAVARVILRPGEGSYSVNGRHLDEYFPRVRLQRMARQPLEVAGYQTRMDVVARIHGGGVSAQATALRHGIARALVEADPALRGELKSRGYLTRDPRVKERKKAGLKKARKRPQFSKR
jgi:small subunit ribosomal protein S9